ncbi:MAG: thioesterase family protein [Chitinophagaceae bacterium]|nr:thioesterase family protein [Chitinophagaceae bacterium]
MARIQIEIPGSEPKCCVHIPVRITDVNYGNHVGNDSMVSIIHEARMQFLKQYGFSELNAGGTALIMSDIAVAFKKESFYGDELEISIYPIITSKLSFELIYKISANRNNEHTLIAIAQTTMVCFDYEKRRVAAMTDDLKRILE